jgi:PKD repeat protein
MVEFNRRWPKSLWIEVTRQPAFKSCKANFSAQPLTGTLLLMVTFTNLSTPTQVITGTLWSYGDGITSTTSALTHTHAYTQAGVYTVTLTVSGEGGSDTLTRTAYITAGSIGYTTTMRVINYIYDDLYRLTGADYSTPAAGAGQAGEAFAYAYDAVGNRTAQTRTLTSTTVTTYTYDAANRLTSVNGVAYTWDDNPLRFATGTTRKLKKRLGAQLQL